MLYLAKTQKYSKVPGTFSHCLPSFTFVIETVDPIDGSALMIATKEKKVLWIFDFVGQQEADCFKRLLSTINIITCDKKQSVKAEQFSVLKTYLKINN